MRQRIYSGKIVFRLSVRLCLAELLLGRSGGASNRAVTSPIELGSLNALPETNR